MDKVDGNEREQVFEHCFKADMLWGHSMMMAIKLEEGWRSESIEPGLANMLRLGLWDWREDQGDKKNFLAQRAMRVAGCIGTKLAFQVKEQEQRASAFHSSLDED